MFFLPFQSCPILYYFCITYCILSSIVRTFDIENDAEIFPAHCTWKVAEKGFKKTFMMNKLSVINSFEIIVENYFCQKSL